MDDNKHAMSNFKKRITTQKFKVHEQDRLTFDHTYLHSQIKFVSCAASFIRHLKM